ncbi:Activator of Hsp90 ATPase 1-like protein [Terriglobus roseus DSM 18391]|uniref:Activator of Hsp90 ATPase 1-like protein n=1 Tax=Terriglobus roseus (strain DSM 18391 / NRRL B-41598 / KBS 63) TaxID=926566 RepID=I3ZH45_TERRK|nr:SRPBCC family protein [Terriglobus roseus]AFL88563.1 Activator of Hsp90 ATPase 1-like protein [Terriglobus roseus DSM 18391]AFL88904.1 Activator of Hsp90 ATPase 1-like protein [Terriglobus roseus DSM 18391]
MSTPQNPPNYTFPMAQQDGNRYFVPADKTDDGEIIGRSVQIIRQDAQTLFAMWSDIVSIPLWQEYVVSVNPVSERVSHWVMGDPDDADGKRVEFDSEVTELVPGKKIAWRSITDDVKQSGVVTFEETARGTRVTLVQVGKVPAGALGNAIAATAKRSPRQIVTEDLRHFKQFAETGEIPTVKGQPHGDRGISGTIKKWMYGENNPTPPGSSQQ